LGSAVFCCATYTCRIPYIIFNPVFVVLSPSFRFVMSPQPHPPISFGESCPTFDCQVLLRRDKNNAAFQAAPCTCSVSCEYSYLWVTRNICHLLFDRKGTMNSNYIAGRRLCSRHVVAPPLSVYLSPHPFGIQLKVFFSNSSSFDSSFDCDRSLLEMRPLAGVCLYFGSGSMGFVRTSASA